MFSHYFSSHFLFDTGVAVYSRGDKYLLIFNILIFLAGIVANVLASNRAKKKQPSAILLSKWASLLLTMGVIALLWSVMREQGVVLLSSHIIIEVIYIIAIVWLVPILKYQFTKYKVFAAEQKKIAEREKYLPK